MGNDPVDRFGELLPSLQSHLGVREVASDEHGKFCCTSYWFQAQA